MNYVSKKEIPTQICPDDIVLGAELSFGCCVHKIKKRSTFTFVTLRTGKFTFLAVHNPKYCEKPLKGVFEGVYLDVKCKVREEKRAENGVEIAITDYTVLSKPAEKYPMPVSDRILDCSPEEIAENRAVSFRNPVERAPMHVVGAVIESFSEFMKNNGFLNVRSPKITQMNFEAEKDSLPFKYFDKNSYLCTDPGVYTQCAVAFFDRVYEVSQVFSGKKRNSPRLLNEYTVMHFEQAYVTDVNDLMAAECSLLEYITAQVSKECAYELDLLEAKLPEIKNVPVITFNEAMKLLKKEESQPDLDPTDEKRLCKWAKEEHNCEFVFVTEYPADKRPSYYARGKAFALLFRGMEIAFGGLKKENFENLTDKSLNESYLDFFRYGMPPHGGVATGVERFVMQLLGLRDVRQATLFPRDIHILKP